MAVLCSLSQYSHRRNKPYIRLFLYNFHNKILKTVFKTFQSFFSFSIDITCILRYNIKLHRRKLTPYSYR